MASRRETYPKSSKGPQNTLNSKFAVPGRRCRQRLTCTCWDAWATALAFWSALVPTGEPGQPVNEPHEALTGQVDVLNVGLRVAHCGRVEFARSVSAFSSFLLHRRLNNRHEVPLGVGVEF